MCNLFKISVFLCLFIKYNASFSQMFQLEIIHSKNQQILYSKKFYSETELKKSAQNFLNEYYSNGYLLADYDSIKHLEKNVFKYYFNENQLFQWAKLRKGNLEPKLYYNYFYQKKFDNTAVNYSEISRLFEKIIVYYENNGYPFASIKLDSIKIDSNFISASLFVKKNQQIKIDSILVQGNIKLNKKFLYRYMDIQPSSLYNEKKMQKIESKLKKLPFVMIRQSPLVRISDKYTKIYIYADNKNVSQFDGIIGLQPDVTGKTIITGNIKLKIINMLFKNAEVLDIDWQRVQALTQNFKLYFSIPYIAGTNLGTQYQLTLFKKDTSFIDVQNNIGLSYFFSGINNIHFFYKQRNSNIISTYGLSGITTLPDYADITTRFYGTGINFNNTNNINNPSSGWNIQMQFSVGNKDIKKNPKINEMVYKNILLHSLQYQSEGALERYFPKIFTKYTAIKLSIKYGHINGNAPLFKNELFRIGGLKSIRGFNEQSIYANSYIIPGIEYRFIYNENGYIALFSDMAYYTSDYSTIQSNNKVYSIGAGIQLDTKAGLFNLSYALGSNFGQSPDFRTGKIHAGLISIF